MGCLKSSSSILFFSLAPMGHSLLFAVGAWIYSGPPHDGVREGVASQSVSRPLAIWATRSETLNGIAAPLVPHGNDPVRRSGLSDSAFSSFSVLSDYRVDGGRDGFPAEAELGSIPPDTVEDHGELARHCDAGSGQAASSGDLHPPRPQARPTGRARAGTG